MIKRLCPNELRSAVSVERVLEGRVSFPRGVVLGAWAARQEARKGTYDRADE
jgi:hypothetical protein